MTKRQISPALQELEKIHDLLWKIRKPVRFGRAGSTPVNPDLWVINIVPRGRRRENGWVNNSKIWTSVTEEINAKLKDETVPHFGTIYIAAESLGDSIEDIIWNMMHQMTHAEVDFESELYHAWRFQMDFEHMWEMKLTREEVVGWVTMDKKDKRTRDKWRAILKVVQPAVNPTAFDIYRQKDPEVEENRPGSRLKLWECGGCKPPVKVRVARPFKAVCQRCQRVFVYADKDRDKPSIYNWLSRNGLSDRIKPVSPTLKAP